MSEYLLVKSDKNFGVPEQKKFPLPDADHVRSAIKFFNYVEPKYEKQLAKAILAKAEEFGVDLSEMNIGKNNRFKKYLVHSELYHHGIKGQKWGERNFQNEDGSLTAAGRERYGAGGLVGRTKKVVSGTLANLPGQKKGSQPVKLGVVKKSPLPKSTTASEGSEKDPDWKMVNDDKNYEQHRIGETDFFMYTRSDGSRFMVEEDSKWEIPAGMTAEEAIKWGQKEIDETVAQRQAEWNSKTDEEKKKELEKAKADLNKSYDKMADDVIKGKYGNGKDRVKALGASYDEVQKRVNEKLHAKHSDLGGYELYHHGILGQKWGIRRFQNKDGSYTSEGKKRRRSGYEEYKDDTNWRKVRNMSDKDLDQKIERLKKEKQYKELRYEQMSDGEKFVHDVLSDAGKKAAKAVAAGALVFAGRAILNKILPGSGSDIRLPKK